MSLDADSSGHVSSAFAVGDDEDGPERIGWLVSSGATEQLLQLVLVTRLLSTAVVWLLSMSVPRVAKKSRGWCSLVLLDVLEQHSAARMMPEADAACWAFAALRVQNSTASSCSIMIAAPDVESGVSGLLEQLTSGASRSVRGRGWRRAAHAQRLRRRGKEKHSKV